ncbi:MAG TPA: DnaA N-terminal domain-containing protein, partial [Acidimicrobiales bacterium]|nr:DnaA N-terminal domain-containing protein [Acidimicrobiales bacterium]
MGDAERVWDTCLDVLRRQVPEATWNSCFQPTTALALEDTTLVVAVPSSLVRDRLEGRWLPQIKNSLAAAGVAELQVRFETRPDAAGADSPLALAGTGADSPRTPAP